MKCVGHALDAEQVLQAIYTEKAGGPSVEQTVSGAVKVI